MVRTLVDGSFGRRIVQPENLAASVPYRYAVSVAMPNTKETVVGSETP